MMLMVWLHVHFPPVFQAFLCTLTTCGAVMATRAVVSTDGAQKLLLLWTHAVSIPLSRPGAATVWGCPLLPGRRWGPGRSVGFAVVMTQKSARAWLVSGCVWLQVQNMHKFHIVIVGASMFHLTFSCGCSTHADICSTRLVLFYIFLFYICFSPSLNIFLLSSPLVFISTKPTFSYWRSYKYKYTI